MEVFMPNRIQARPIAIEDAVSRTNQRFWRVKLDTNDTLYTYQGSTINNLAKITPQVPGQPLVPSVLLPHVVNQVCVFDLEQKGKYFHITASALGGQPAAVSQTPQLTPSAPAPAPIAQAPVTQVPGTPVMTSEGYPATWDQSQPPATEQTMQDIATPQTMAPGFTKTQQYKQYQANATGGEPGKNAGVCMSYAKDLAVAGRVQIDQLVTVAEMMFNWVEAHK